MSNLVFSLILSGSLAPLLRMAIQVHDSHNHNLLGLIIDPVNHPVGEAVKSAAAVRFIQRLPRTRVRQYQVNRAAELVQKFDTQSCPCGLIVSERLLQIRLGWFEKRSGHGGPVERSRCTTSSAGFACTCPEA